MNHRKPLVAATIVLLSVCSAFAEARPRVEVRVDVAREVVRTGADGTRRTVEEPVTNVSPGDTLVYRLTADNVGRAAARNARLQDPIPAGTVLVPDSVSVEGAAVTASIDGGKSFAPFPVVVERVTAEGEMVRTPVAASAYTHLRWQLAGPLESGDQRSVEFKVRVE